VTRSGDVRMLGCQDVDVDVDVDVGTGSRDGCCSGADLSWGPEINILACAEWRAGRIANAFFCTLAVRY